MARKPTGRLRSRKLHAWVRPELFDEFGKAIEDKGLSRDGGIEQALTKFLEKGDSHAVQQ